MGFARILGLAALAVGLSVLPAAAEVGEFYGIWSNASADASGIARIVVTPGDGNRATVHLYGRCRPADCDWGSRPARTYSADPSVAEIRSIAADFDAGGALRRIVLRTAVGHTLAFEIQTDFPDGSDHRDFATAGVLAYAGDWNVAPRVASASASPSLPVAAPEPIPPPPPHYERPGGPSLVGVGPALASGYVPAAGEDCRPFHPEQVRTGNVDGQWRVGDFANRLLNFGSHQAAARRTLLILDYHHFDEQCFVGHTEGAMLYWKRAGQVPGNSMNGEDCTAFDRSTVRVGQTGDSWRVMAGGTLLLSYDEKADAERAASVIATYKLNRQCFFSRDDSEAQYWLSQ